ncbi:hypothetical protein OH76DRAFT_1179208 [Lentinus brumalis]|uniref:Uncharacterized protein n=1 Tax=Lentinus brumalis TaxID=2498619 RepID=A0A371CU82_9APHY|nr:hypothetical protein OH76DRAFT_1179208 [Polyporus brumalis]
MSSSNPEAQADDKPASPVSASPSAGIERVKQVYNLCKSATFKDLCQKLRVDSVLALETRIRPPHVRSCALPHRARTPVFLAYHCPVSYVNEASAHVPSRWDEGGNAPRACATVTRLLPPLLTPYDSKNKLGNAIRAQVERLSATNEESSDNTRNYGTRDAQHRSQ